MNKRKNIAFLTIGIPLIIFFVTLVLVFSSFFAIKQEQMDQEISVELGKLEDSVTKTETVGSECSGGGGNIYPQNKSPFYPDGYYCGEKRSRSL